MKNYHKKFYHLYGLPVTKIHARLIFLFFIILLNQRSQMGACGYQIENLKKKVPNTTKAEQMCQLIKFFQVKRDQMQLSLHKNIAAIIWRNPKNQIIGKGSGLLISKNLLLTCAHLFYHNLQRVDYKLLQIYPGLAGKLENAYRIEEVYIPQQYSSAFQNKPLQFDYALVKLNKKVNSNEFLPLNGFYESQQKQQLAIYGYPDRYYCKERKDNQQSAEQWGIKLLNTVLQVKEHQRSILYIIPTAIGVNGAPIVYRSGNKCYVVGIHIGCQNIKTQDMSAQVNSGRLLNPQLIAKLKEEASEMKAELFTVLNQRNFQKIESNFQRNIQTGKRNFDFK